ncbi:saposin-like protein 11 [Vigna radiata var. radiata]|uniref:Saposin-like protein 11 n=1 Tax=Vigna radiata var. radiata TaxID=3916 RepID=A0A1S3VHT9_VIGRR|nr:saposin-like protein 11 [Vigna radiata var. radiata]
MGCSSFSMILTVLVLTFSSMMIDSRVAEARVVPKSDLPSVSKVGLPVTLPIVLPVPLPEIPVPVPVPDLGVPVPKVPVPVPIPVHLPTLTIPKLKVNVGGVKIP